MSNITKPDTASKTSMRRVLGYLFHRALISRPSTVAIVGSLSVLVLLVRLALTVTPLLLLPVFFEDAQPAQGFSLPGMSAINASVNALASENRSRAALIALAVLAGLFVTAAVLSLVRHLYLTRLVRREFEYSTERISARVDQHKTNGTLWKYTSGELSAMMLRDARYLGVAQMRILDLVIPLFTLLVMGGILVWVLPVAGLALFVSLAVLLPLQMRIVRTSRDSGERIAEAASSYRRAVAAEVDAFARDPAPMTADHKGLVPADKNEAFMGAFMTRMRLVAFSRVVTETSLLLAVIAVIFLLTSGGSVKLQSFSFLLFVLLLLQFLGRSLSSIIETVTSLISLHEFIFRGIAFITKSPAPEDRLDVIEDLPDVFVLVSVQREDARTQSILAQRLGVTASNFVEFDPDTASMPDAGALIVPLAALQPSGIETIDSLREKAPGAKLLISTLSPPRRSPLPGELPVYVLDGPRLNPLTDLATFVARRDEFIERLTARRQNPGISIVGPDFIGLD